MEQKDFKVKVHDHRIELGEIMLEKHSTHNDEFGQSEISTMESTTDCNETLRTYLSKRLPTYMIPSHFMTVSAFPLSPNGKVDQESLPEISTSIHQKKDADIAPSTELEKTIVNIWQKLIHNDQLDLSDNKLQSNELKQLPLVTNDTVSSTCAAPSDLFESDTRTASQISTKTNFYSLGGDSLQLVQLYRHYQTLFDFDAEALTIRPFFEYNTIDEHVKLLETIIPNDMQSRQWHTLHINEGKTFLNAFL
jgi:acyl carrier protein